MTNEKLKELERKNLEAKKNIYNNILFVLQIIKEKNNNNSLENKEKAINNLTELDDKTKKTLIKQIKKIDKSNKPPINDEAIKFLKKLLIQEAFITTKIAKGKKITTNTAFAKMYNDKNFYAIVESKVKTRMKSLEKSNTNQNSQNNQ